MYSSSTANVRGPISIGMFLSTSLNPLPVLYFLYSTAVSVSPVLNHLAFSTSAMCSTLLTRVLTCMFVPIKSSQFSPASPSNAETLGYLVPIISLRRSEGRGKEATSGFSFIMLLTCLPNSLANFSNSTSSSL